MERISVYIDGANFYYGLRSINKRYTDSKFDFERFIKKIVGNRKLVKVYYYNASLKQEINKNIFQRQQKLFERLKKIKKFEVVLCRRQKRTSADGKDHFTIKGDDIHLALDMLKDAYEDKYDTAILVSGDGDFSYLVQYVKSKKKKVENYHFEGNVSFDLLKKCNTNSVINRKTVNRFFYREDPFKIQDTKIGKKMKGLFKKKS